MQLAGRWECEFDADERREYAGSFYRKDIVQERGERLPDGSCRPRTQLFKCGVHTGKR
eukprot:gene27658-19059_t